MIRFKKHIAPIFFPVFMVGISLFLSLNTCERFEPKLILKVRTDSIITVFANSFGITGEIVYLGDSKIIQHGFCFSENNDPTIENGTISELGERSATGSFQSSFSGLKHNTTYQVKAYATDQEGTIYGSQLSFNTPSPSLPAITTKAVTNITSDSARSGGTITDDGGDSVTARGVCWGTSSIPTIESSHTNNGSGLGSFNSLISGLSCSTTYYVRAYATNGSGTTYGEAMSFVSGDCPEGLPVLTTDSISNITASSARSGGNVSDVGSSSVIARGVCWSESSTPTIADSQTSDGSGSGAFSSLMTGLSSNTNYYVRAYATNSQGTGYGNVINFKTIEVSGETVTDYDGNVYNTVQIGDQIWMQSNLRVTHFADGTPIPLIEDDLTWETRAVEKSYCWYDNDIGNAEFYGALYNWTAAMNGAANSLSNPSNVQGVCPSGWHLPSDAEWKQLEIELGMSQIEANNLNMRGTTEGGKLKETGTDNWLNPNTGATNESGFTAVGAGHRGDNGVFNNLNYSTEFWTATESGPNFPFLRWLDSENGGIWRNNENRNIGISVRCIKGEGYSIPTITTSVISSITDTSAQSGGEVISDGGAAVTEKGVCWSTSSNPTIDDNKTINGSGLGLFTSDITNLAANTEYYVRAYATNSYGTSYGEEINFTTTASGVPETPINLVAFPGDKEVKLSWNSAPESNNYKIYWSENPAVSKTNFEGIIQDIPSTMHLQTGLVAGKTYYYVATAVNGNGESSESRTARATIPELFESNTISSTGQKQYYEISVSNGEELFITTDIADDIQRYYLYVKFGSLPTTTDYDAKSETSDDEAISIMNTESGTYYIMVYAYDHNSGSGDYTITGSTSVPVLYMDTDYKATISHSDEKDFYEVEVNEGQNLFVNTNREDDIQDYYLYIKYGSLPTRTENDALSESGQDEAISVMNTQAGTYYIMVYAFDHNARSGNYNIQIRDHLK